jgi:hypothetical protein
MNESRRVQESAWSPGSGPSRHLVRLAIAASVLLVGCQSAAPGTVVPPTAGPSPSAAAPSTTVPSPSAEPSATARPAAGTWVEAGEMTVPREAPHVVLLGDGRVLAVGNDGSFDPEYNVPFCHAPEEAAAAELWDPATGRWTTTEALNSPRALLVAVPLADGRALVTGGATGPKTGADPWVIGGFQSYSSTWIFDPRTESWTRSGLLDTARANALGATLPDGRVLVAGGFFADFFRWSDWRGLLDDRYNQCVPPQDGIAGDVFTAAWHPAGPLLDVPMPHPPARLLGSAEVFDPAAGTWSGTGSMAVPRAGGSAVTLADGRVLLAELRGSYEDVFYELSRDDRSDRVAEVYDPATGRFRVTAEYPSGQFMPRDLVALAEGGALLFGNAWKSVPDSEVDEEWTAVLRYDPATNQWRDAGRLAITRERPTIALLPDGRILVAGGSDQYGPTLTTEIYDPATGTTTPGAPMPEPRAGARAVVLQDGSVLLVGGYGRHTSMAVRYVPGP